MSTTKKSEKSSGSTYNIENNTISTSAIGDNAAVYLQTVDADKLNAFSQKLHELQNELTQLSNNLHQEDASKVKAEIAVIDNELKNSNAITAKVIFDSLQAISVILSKAGSAGIILKQLFDLAKITFGGN